MNKLNEMIVDVLCTESCEVPAWQTMSEIDTHRSDRTKASTAADRGIGHCNNVSAGSFLINSAFSATSKLSTSNAYCWSRNRLVAIDWTQLRVNLICIIVILPVKNNSMLFAMGHLQWQCGHIQCL